MKKKLVFFIGGLNFGGMERVVFIAAELLKEMYDITIVTLYQTDADYEVKAKLYNLDVPPKTGKLQKAIGFCKRLIRAKKMKKDIKPDIVFSFGMYSNYLNALTKGDEKIVMGIRSYDWLTKPFITSGLDKYIVSKFDSINSVSKLIAKDAEEYWGIPIEKNRVIYNPYDVEYIKSLSFESVEDFEFDEKNYYITTMGRLSAQKGYNHLIRAIAEVIKEYPNVRLLIMGNGDKKEQLEKMISAYGLVGKVILLSGKKNPHKYVRKSDLYVLSSITEGFPNALAETMCVGTPIVAVNCKSGPSEILFGTLTVMSENEDFMIGEYGILSKELVHDASYDIRPVDKNEKALANAICYAYENPENMKRMARNAQKHMKKFSYEVFKENIKNALEE